MIENLRYIYKKEEIYPVSFSFLFLFPEELRSNAFRVIHPSKILYW